MPDFGDFLEPHVTQLTYHQGLLQLLSTAGSRQMVSDLGVLYTVGCAAPVLVLVTANRGWPHGLSHILLGLAQAAAYCRWLCSSYQ